MVIMMVVVTVFVMLVMMMMVTSFLMIMPTVCLSTVAALMASSSSLPEHLIYYGLLRLLGHLISHDKLHCLLAHEPIHLLALLFHQLLDVHALVSEPAQVVCDQMQVIAALTPNEHHTRFVSVLSKCTPLSMLAHVAGEHDHEKPFPTSRCSLDFLRIN